ncbi:MAG: hypothetical protein ACLQU3_23185 [Limisphaerales bacterium]
MNTTEEIVQFLIQTIASSGPITGARLGARVKDQFPGFDWKKDFGSLNSFIQRQCPDKVVLVSSTPDHMWALAEAAGDQAQQIPARTPTSAWQAFVNERIAERVFVSTETGEVSIVPAVGAPPAGSVEVPKISHGDHLQIAKEFVGRMDPSDQAQFRGELEKPDYWQRWNTALKFVKGGHYLIAWHEFRVQRICDLYSARLREAGIASDEIVARSVENLRRLRSEAYSQKQRQGSPAGKAVPALPYERRRERQARPLQEIAIEAVRSLSEEDLRRLWLPMGVVIDALRGG